MADDKTQGEVEMGYQHTLVSYYQYQYLPKESIIIVSRRWLAL